MARSTYKVKLAEAPNETQLASADSAASGDNPVSSYDKLGITVQPLSRTTRHAPVCRRRSAAWRSRM